MFNSSIRFLALCIATILHADLACAQRGGGQGGGGLRGGAGGMMGGGGPQGAGMMGSAGGGGRGMCSGANGNNAATDGTQASTTGSGFFAGDAIRNQQGRMRHQGMTSSQGNTGSGIPAANTARPTAAQFVQAAMTFDHNEDGELNEEELTLVATAVITELQTRRQQRHEIMAHAGAFQSQTQSASTGLPPDATMTQITTSFVTRALTFDRDSTGTLNSQEIRGMATELIRQIG